MSVMNSGLSLYRKTLKRFKPFHAALHWVMTHSVIPLLEKKRSFETIADDPFWFRLELLTGRHETATTQKVQTLLQPGMTVLDIGAHVGYYARLFSNEVKENGRVIAFEPHPRTFEVLGRNIQAFPNIQALNLAASDSEGSAELYDYLMMSASGSLNYDESMVDLQQSQTSSHDIAPRLKGFEMQTFSVQTRPGDVCLAELNIEKVDFIKMDIEGAEIKALRGLQHTIQNSPNLYMVMEYNPAALRSFGFEPIAAIEEVRSMGFGQVQVIHENGTIDDLHGKPHELEQLTQDLLSHMGVVNMLFYKAT
ncbi:hypothetical protein MASR2M15_29040 [Anaerolineales bacterium]